jgi:hypothetical protein
MKQLIKLAVYGIGVAILLQFVGIGVAPVQAQSSSSRGYTTTPAELRAIAQKAKAGIEPYKSAVKEVIEWANRPLPTVPTTVTCRDADDPQWIDDKGVGVVYASAMAYHLTGDKAYARKVVKQIKQILKNVTSIPIDEQQCRLNFSWGIPELVASADLIEDFWRDKDCPGPVSAKLRNTTMRRGDCKVRFQNWLAKNAYHVVSLSAPAQSNWGAAAANATAYISDYLWDRSDVVLVHRHPPRMLNGAKLKFSPAQAYDYANRLLKDRMNGNGVEHNGSTSCDFLTGSQQRGGSTPVKSQFSEKGIIPDDTRREQYCNVAIYNGDYQNYPQLHISNTVQHCELMLRRGDRSCYNNVRNDDIPQYRFIGPDGKEKVTHLYPGRGSVERVINAVIVDSGTEWKHDAGLWVAYRYYVSNARLGQVGQWKSELDRSGGCSQAVCFGKLTHGFAAGEIPTLPPTVAPPRQNGTTAPDGVLPLPPPPPSA